MKNFKEQLTDLYDLVINMRVFADEINDVANMIADSSFHGGKIFIIGNGGSAADASHFAGELVGRYKKERPTIPCEALTTDIATITAIANDYGYEHIFSRQLEEQFNMEQDILITLSTSGNSKNIINAIQYVVENGGRVLNLLGKDGGEVAKIANGFIHDIIVPSDDTPRIQEIHKFILHYIAEVIENYYVENYNGGVYNK